VPGLQYGTQGNYYSRFETRGLRDTQDVLVLMDGVPLRLLQGNADITLIAPDLVDRLEFIKGPASALYGKNAIGGVAQFFMKPERAALARSDPRNVRSSGVKGEADMRGTGGVGSREDKALPSALLERRQHLLREQPHPAQGRRAIEHAVAIEDAAQLPDARARGERLYLFQARSRIADDRLRAQYLGGIAHRQGAGGLPAQDHEMLAPAVEQGQQLVELLPCLGQGRADADVA